MTKFEKCFDDCMEKTSALTEEEVRAELENFKYILPETKLTVTGLRKILCNLRCENCGGGGGGSAAADSQKPAENNAAAGHSLDTLEGRIKPFD